MQIGFQDDHFKNTPPISTPRDNRPITKWLGISNAESRRQETTRKTSCPDYVSIWKDDFDFETLVGKHEGDRRGMSFTPSPGLFYKCENVFPSTTTNT